MSLTNMSERPELYFEDADQSSKLAKNSKAFPFYPIAIGLCAATCAYGAYMYKRRGNMSTSVYLMQLRVTAQGLAVGTLTVGLAYTMIRDNLFNKEDSE